MRFDYALNPAQRADARAALKLLEGTGVSLEEAARRAIHGRRAVHRIRISDAIDSFIRSRLTGGKRLRTVEWYQDKLRLVDASFGAKYFDDVDRATLFAWLAQLPGSEGSRAAVARACRALWRWGMAHEPQLVAVDITAGLRTASPSNGGDAEFLTVKQVAAIMAKAGPYRSALALLFFGGVRPEELYGRSKTPLLWKHVRADERMIRLPGEIAKTGKPRIIEGIPETLWHWIEPKTDGALPVSPGRTRQALERAQAAIAPKKWPHDATRHTFGTYAFAWAQDAGKVAMWMGHEGKPTMLHRHYRGLTTRAEAEQFWALRPAANKL